MSDLVVTTSGKAKADLIRRAEEAAARLGVPFIPRPYKEPLGPMLGSVRAALVFGELRVELWDAHGHTVFTEGMAALRMRRYAQGDRRDHLVRAAEFEPGDEVFDATFGLGQDAMVAACAVGPRGRVVGVEKSLALYALVSEGLAARPPDSKSARIELVHGDSAHVLASVPPRSFDVVLFDPMFAKARGAQPAFELVRRHADHAPLTGELLELGKRAARRMVLVKGARNGGDLRRLGLAATWLSRSGDVSFARIPV